MVNFYFVQLILLIIIVLLISYQYLIKRVDPIIRLLFVFLFALMRTATDLLLNPLGEVWDTRKEVHNIFLVFTLLSLYTFLEYALNDKPIIRRTILIYSMSGLFLGFYTAAFLYDMRENPRNWPLSSNIPFWDFPLDILQISVWIFSTYGFLRMAKFSNNQNSKKYSIVLSFASFLFVISSFLELSEHFTGKEIPAAITTTPAMLILTIMYLNKPSFAYSSPTNLFRLLIIHTNGQTLVQKHLSDKYKDNPNDSILFGGITSSMNEIFKEVTKGEGDLRKIQTLDSTFIFKKSKSIFAVLEAEKSTRILQTALDNFADAFEKKYHQQLIDFSGDLSDFHDSDVLIRVYFPFI